MPTAGEVDRGASHPHHIQHWVDGGATDLNNGVLLCQHHHTTIHTKGWTVRMGDDGHPEYLPPPWGDPYQNIIRPNDQTLVRRP
nr:HNH endonuclease signature motif containing protein [Actinopolymorpha pittospori]